MVKCLHGFEYFFCILNFISKIEKSKVTDYAAIMKSPDWDEATPKLNVTEKSANRLTTVKQSKKKICVVLGYMKF